MKPKPAPRRGRPFNDVPTAPLNVRVPAPQLAWLDLLRGDTPPGTYVGTLFEREARRRKLTPTRVFGKKK